MPCLQHVSFRASGVLRQVRVAVIREEGSNGDREMGAAVYSAGMEPWDITMSDLLHGRASLHSFGGAPPTRQHSCLLRREPWLDTPPSPNPKDHFCCVRLRYIASYVNALAAASTSDAHAYFVVHS